MKKFLYNLRHNRNLAIGTVMVLIVVLVAIFADQIAPYNFDDSYVAAKFTKPCKEFPFGTDDFGRDMFSRVVYGSRISLRVALLAAVIEIFLGVSIGLLSGYYGGGLDRFCRSSAISPGPCRPSSCPWRSSPYWARGLRTSSSPLRW